MVEAFENRAGGAGEGGEFRGQRGLREIARLVRKQFGKTENFAELIAQVVARRVDPRGIGAAMRHDAQVAAGGAEAGPPVR